MYIDFVSRLCPVCGGEDSQPVFTDVNRREGLSVLSTLVSCLNCSMRYVNPAPDEVSLAQLYSDGVVDPVELITNLFSVSRTTVYSPICSVLRRVNGALRGHPHNWPDEEGHGRSILDFGCHDAKKLLRWYQRGWQVAGVDLNERAIEIARQRFPDGRFWCGDLLELDIPERYDFIRSDNVIEHLLEPTIYLNALVNLLKPGGQLRVFVPNGMALSARLFGRYSAIFWMPFHLNLFKSATLIRLIKQVGLQNTQCFTFTPVGSWTWTQRQWLLKPGFNRRLPSRLDRVLQRISILNYPGETIAQWVGMGEELVATGQRGL